MAQTFSYKERFGLTDEDLNLSLEEWDKRCDKDTSFASLHGESLKNEKKMRNIGTKTTKKAKSNEKTEKISEIFKFLTENGTENCKIVNESREISFTIGKNRYSLTLTKHN